VTRGPVVADFFPLYLDIRSVLLNIPSCSLDLLLVGPSGRFYFTVIGFVDFLNSGFLIRRGFIRRGIDDRYLGLLLVLKTCNFFFLCILQFFYAFNIAMNIGFIVPDILFVLCDVFVDILDRVCVRVSRRGGGLPGLGRGGVVWV